MSQHYSDESREEETYSLPDVEVFYVDTEEATENATGSACDDDDERDYLVREGWYFWHCFPGCMPDSDPSGPYETEEAAIAAMREENDA